MSDPEDPGGNRPDLVSITDEQSVPVDEAALHTIAAHALGVLRISAELSIALVDGPKIADLKGRYYGEHAATDVLAFPMDGVQGPTLGDVVICPAFVARNARGLGSSLTDELRYVTVHGILHLAGRDHQTPDQELSMAAEERAILASA